MKNQKKRDLGYCVAASQASMFLNELQKLTIGITAIKNARRWSETLKTAALIKSSGALGPHLSPTSAADIVTIFG